MDNAIGLGIILSLQDKASSGLESIRNKLTVLRDVSQDMVKQFEAGTKQMLGEVASMAAGAKVLETLESTFGASITTAADFEQAMARVGAASGATGEDFEALTKQAKELGATTQFSASQAAESQESLARAGFKTNEIISAMPGLLDMAAAEGMDLASAADIASSAIRGFGLDASEAGRVADVLAKTSSASNTSIASLGESLKYVAPYAKAVGVDIEQTNAMLGVMANAGIKGTVAGNALKSALSKLSEEPTRVSKALAELGVKAKTSEGKLRPFPELMKDLSEKMKNMGEADKVGIFNKIFGSAAGGGMLAIMDAVANGSLPELEAALYNCSGAAKEIAERMNATRLESASEGLRIVIGNHLLPTYTWVINKMAKFKGWLTQLIEDHPIISKAVIGFTTALIGLSGAALILVGALASVGGFIKMWPLLKVMAVSALSSIRTQARMALGSLSGLGAPVVGMIALAGALYLAWRKNLWGIRNMVTAVSEGFKMALRANTDGIVDVDEELANKLKAAGVWDFAVTMGKVFFRVRQFWNGLVEGFKQGVQDIRSIFSVVSGFISPFLESGRELLEMLGLLSPIAETQSNTWREWGQLLGRIAPFILAIVAAFKTASIITGIVQGITGAFTLLNTALLANPIGAVIAGLVAAGIYLYLHWEEVSEWLSGIWEDIAGYAQAAADWIKEKWQGAIDWWNSWTIADVFAPVKEFASSAVSWGQDKLQGLRDWWDSWTLKDVFASVFESVSSLRAKILYPFEALNNWLGTLELPDIFQPIVNVVQSLLSLFLHPFDTLKSWLENFSLPNIFASLSNMAYDTINSIKGLFSGLGKWIMDTIGKLNSFNWELPSWLGGGKAGNNQVNNANAALAGYQPPSVPAYATGGIITRPHIGLVGEAGREAIIPLEDRSIGLPLLMSAISELGVGNNDILPYLNPVEPEIAQPSVNVSTPVPVISPAPINVQPLLQSSPVVNVPSPNVFTSSFDTSRFENVISGLIDNLNNKETSIKLIAPQSQATSSPLLIQHSQNQAMMNSQAQAQVQPQTSNNPVSVNNHVDVSIEGKPVELYIDGEKVGSAVLRWVTKQNVRNGASEF